jgi:hypothetical protein
VNTRYTKTGRAPKGERTRLVRPDSIDFDKAIGITIIEASAGILPALPRSRRRRRTAGARR